MCILILDFNDHYFSPHDQRCKMTAVHQDTGVIDKLGPLDVLRTYRAPAAWSYSCHVWTADAPLAGRGEGEGRG